MEYGIDPAVTPISAAAESSSTLMLFSQHLYCLMCDTIHFVILKLFSLLFTFAFCLLPFAHNTIKDPQWYSVQVSDTTMMPRASVPGQ